MDITSFIGLIVAGGFVIFGILDSGDMGNFYDKASIAIVLGGTLGSVIASYPFGMLKNAGKHFLVLAGGKKFRPEPVIDTLVEFAQIARKNGLLALEEKANELEDPFFKQGIMFVVDAMEEDKVRAMLEAEVESMAQRHDEAAGIYDKASVYAPAFGMIGTLVGLINMLKDMDMSAGSSASLGENMSVALVTTFYGCLLSNVLFLPIAKKLRIRNDEEILYRQIIIEGVLGIQAGHNPKSLKEKLASYLSQKRKLKILDAEGTEKKTGEKKEKKERKGQK